MGRGSGLAGYPCKMTVLGSIPNDSTISSNGSGEYRVRRAKARSMNSPSAPLAHVGRGTCLRSSSGSVRHRRGVPIRYRKLYQMTSLMRNTASNFNKSGIPLDGRLSRKILGNGNGLENRGSLKALWGFESTRLPPIRKQVALAHVGRGTGFKYLSGRVRHPQATPTKGD